MSATSRADEARIEWALGEKLGAETPPDVSSLVLERHRAGEGELIAASLDRGAVRRWPQAWVAAMVLLGVTLVVCLAVTNGPDPVSPDEGNRGAVDDQDPKPVQVWDAASIAALPLDTKAILASDCDDAMLESLTRFRELAYLSVQNRARMIYGLMLKISPASTSTMTDAGFLAISKLPKLRALDIAGQRGVTGAALSELARLTLLRTLRLRFCDVEDAQLIALRELRALECLDLSFNYGFGAAGIDVITRCSNLRELSLRGCQQLQGAQIARLARLPRLEILDLGAMDRIALRWDPTPSERSGQFVSRAQRLAVLPGAGVSDVALAGFAEFDSLRTLRIPQGRYSTIGVASLGGLDRLERLDLGFTHGMTDDVVSVLGPNLLELRVTGDQTDRFCQLLSVRMKRLESLDVGSDEITDAGVESLSKIASLRSLELVQCRGLTAECLDAICRLQNLERLDLRHVGWGTVAQESKLRASLPKLNELRMSIEERER